MKKISTPQSREVRLSQGVLQGEYEDIAYSIYSGNADDLKKSIVRLELTDELHKSKAVEQFRAILIGRASLSGGFIGVDEINNGAKDWHESAILADWERET